MKSGRTGRLDAWTASSFENVFRDAEKPSGSTLFFSIVAARNEYESFQVVLRGDMDFTIDGVAFSDMAAGGRTLPAGNFRYQFVEYAYLDRNTNWQTPETILRAAPGYFPDALSNEPKMLVRAGEAQPVWITLYIPKTAAAGDYSGKLVVNTSEGDYPVDVRVEVNDVTIPESKDGAFTLMHHQQIAGTWWYEATAGSHPNDVIVQIYGHERWTPQWWALVSDMARTMREYRTNVLNVNTPQLLLDGGTTIDGSGKYVFRWDKFDEYVQFFIDAGVVKMLESIHLGSVIGTVGITFYTYLVARNDAGLMATKNAEAMSPECENWLDQMLPALYAHLMEKGWDAIWHQQVGDECGSELQVRQYAYYMDKLRRHAPGLKCGDPTYVLETSVGSLDKGAEISIPIEDMFQKNIDLYHSYMDKGKIIYIYNCCGPGGIWLNRWIDKPVWQMRTLGWLCWKWRVPGFLHWAWNFWVDWFKQEFCRIEDEEFKGDHYTVYPDVKNNRIKASIRLADLREMSEIYELLCILGRKNPAKARELADVVAVGADDFISDIPRMIECRNELVRAAAR